MRCVGRGAGRSGRVDRGCARRILQCLGAGVGQEGVALPPPHLPRAAAAVLQRWHATGAPPGAAPTHAHMPLQCVGQYHLGEFVNTFRRGSLVMRMPDSGAGVGLGVWERGVLGRKFSGTSVLTRDVLGRAGSSHSGRVLASHQRRSLPHAAGRYDVA